MAPQARLAQGLREALEAAGSGASRFAARTSEAQGVGGVYIISVAARILQMHPQTLRKYERVGLVRPTRTQGMLRLYSELDIARLRLIKHLVENLGLNLAGAQLALAMFNKLIETKADIRRASDADAKKTMEDSIDALIVMLFSQRG